jgi:predicted N-acetyltransferase YhbS
VQRVLKRISDENSLAPVTILSEFQRQGIGGELIRKGIKACQRLGYDSIVVLRHPEYYPKFGFRQANTWGIRDPFGAPAERLWRWN